MAASPESRPEGLSISLSLLHHTARSHGPLSASASRSALEWIVDQYHVKGESDPNREDDPRYIVRLVGQIVRVSLETVRIVNALPAWRTTE
jgi:hypothetical protein